MNTTISKIKETAMRIVFMLCACVSIISVILICVFLFSNGIPTMGKIGFANFLLGNRWKPLEDLYGILPMIIGSIYVTAGAIIIGVPIGVLCAVFLARFCPKGLYKIFKPAVDLLAGIPSIVYGFFGLVVIVPAMQNLFGGSGKSALTASVMLGIMILPTIISVSEAAIRAVPESYYEGALALGATHERSVYTAVVPAAGSGILAGIVLGVGRAMGEAMDIMMVAGNVANMPGLFKSVRFLTTAIASEMSYASGLQRQALFSIALVLFVFIMLLNALLNRILKGGSEDEH